MKKRRAVLLLALVLLAAGLVSLWNAAMFYKGPVTDGSQEYYVNQFSRRAFAGSYVWDGEPDHMTIAIPEEAGSLPVTSLGGYTGRGVPVLFGVTLPEEYRSTLTSQEGMEVQEELVFTVEIGSSVRELTAVDMGYDTVGVRPGATVRYHVSYVYRCAPENPTFYAADGVLYRRADNQPVLPDPSS